MKDKLTLLLILGLLLIIGCSQNITPQETTITGEAMSDGESKTKLTGEIKEFDMTAKNWEFVPNTIEVNLGDKVELYVESVDVTHGFRLPEFGINERLEPGNTVNVEFIADKKGTFSFSCSVPCGSGHGRMNGKLIVK